MPKIRPKTYIVTLERKLFASLYGYTIERQLTMRQENEKDN